MFTATVTGRLVRDPRQIQKNGTTFAYVTVADNDVYDRNTKQYGTQFVEIGFSGARAESIVRNARKGTLISAVCTARVRKDERYTDTMGKGYHPEVVGLWCDRVQFLDSFGKGTGQQQYQQQQGGGYQQQNQGYQQNTGYQQPTQQPQFQQQQQQVPQQSMMAQGAVSQQSAFGGSEFATDEFGGDSLIDDLQF